MSVEDEKQEPIPVNIALFRYFKHQRMDLNGLNRPAESPEFLRLQNLPGSDPRPRRGSRALIEGNLYILLGFNLHLKHD